MMSFFKKDDEAVQQQVLKRLQEGANPESRRRARGLCLDRLLSA